jgi:hypothetical protein
MRAPILLMTLSACQWTSGGAGGVATGDAAICKVQDVRQCDCGAGRKGVETCVSGYAWGACTCKKSSGADVAVAPKKPAAVVCGGVACAPYPNEDTEVGAKGCCTAQNTCGSSSNFLFGAACVERGPAPGKPSPQCPDEAVNFVDLAGCCRPDNTCGLSVDIVNNFDLGCIERTTMQRLLNAGKSSRDALSLVFFLPIVDAAFPAMACQFE